MAQSSNNLAGGFYADVPVRHKFDNLTQPTAYTGLPDDWLIVVSDIVGSTTHVANGRYKLVNTVGAAVISAQINSLGDPQAAGDEPGTDQFPFIFGGDGAAFAIWPEQREKSADALAAVRRWAMQEFDLELRTAIVPLRDIRAAGLDVRVARFAASGDADYAMFAGGGISWAEAQMKAGHYDVPIAPIGTIPDLTGLSCRWTQIEATQGVILSVVLQPRPDVDPVRLATLLHDVVVLTEQLERGGHPVSSNGPGYSWPPAGLALEAHASHGEGSLLWRHLYLLVATLMALFYFRTGIKAGDFDPDHYVKTVGRNADFRKFDDGLKMTLDCDRQTVDQLTEKLSKARDDGLIDFGLFEQNEAMVTCIVPSITRDDHIHVIDGAAGGYTSAAEQIKRAAASSKQT